LGAPFQPNLYEFDPGLIELSELRPGISLVLILDNGKSYPTAFENPALKSHSISIKNLYNSDRFASIQITLQSGIFKRQGLNFPSKSKKYPLSQLIEFYQIRVAITIGK
jgi:hypothetical protein